MTAKKFETAFFTQKLGKTEVGEDITHRMTINTEVIRNVVRGDNKDIQNPCVRMLDTKNPWHNSQEPKTNWHQNWN